MGDRYGSGSTYDDRKSYASFDYVPGSRQSRVQSDYYEDREQRPYHSLYKHSFETPDDRYLEDSGTRSRRRSVARYDERNGDRGSDRHYEYDVDRRGGDRRNRDRDTELSDRRSESDYEQKGGNLKPNLKRHFKEKEERMDGLVGKEKKDIAATVVGALAGGFLGYEAGHGRPAGALGGALLGGLAGNAIEHRHLKDQTTREKRDRKVDDDD